MLNGDLGRKPIPEEYIQREQPYRSEVLPPTGIDNDVVEKVANPPVLGSGLKNAFAPYKKTLGSGPVTGSHVLLQGDPGGLYLSTASYDSFLAICRRMLPAEVSKTHALVFYIDVRKVGDTSVEPVTIDGALDRQRYAAEIKPLLDTPGQEFRIRHGGEPSKPFKDSDYAGECVKLTAQNIGYAWIDAPWDEEDEAHNNTDIVTEALQFLFPRETSNITRFTMVIPDKGSHDINLRNGEEAVRPKVQARLAEVTDSNKENENPVVVLVYDEAHPPFKVSMLLPFWKSVTELRRVPFLQAIPPLLWEMELR